MANSFASLKKSRSNDLQKLQSEVEKINNPQNNFSREDDRFWKAELDKSGNGYAVIRFLPPPNGEEMAWAKICLLYTSPSPRDRTRSRMPSSA